MNKFLFLCVILLSSFSVSSLEIDEKLTLRIVGISNSRKTILINRGIEDGLAIGDHAKFFVSVGVVSRGVVIKTSPTRSVWSLYRLVNKEYIREEQVLKLKITPAVKITKDESKMMVKDDTRQIISKDPRDLGIPLADGADDLSTAKLNPRDSIGWETEAISLLSKNREIFGMGSYSSYTQETKPDDNSGSYSREITNLYFKIGGEWYFHNEEKWFSRFSFQTHFALVRTSIMDYKGAVVREQGSEFGFGISLHPTTRPSQIHRFIPYLNYTLTLGSTNSSYEQGEEGVGNPSSEESIDAAVFAHSFGGGYKYYTVEGIGLRLELSYYLRGDDFTEDSGQTSWVRTQSGPRLVFGLSYRL